MSGFICRQVQSVFGLTPLRRCLSRLPCPDRAVVFATRCWQVVLGDAASHRCDIFAHHQTQKKNGQDRRYFWWRIGGCSSFSAIRPGPAKAGSSAARLEPCVGRDLRRWLDHPINGSPPGRDSFAGGRTEQVQPTRTQEAQPFPARESASWPPNSRSWGPTGSCARCCKLST